LVVDNYETVNALRDKVVGDLQEIVKFFRRGEDEEGYARLVNSLESLEKLLSLAAHDNRIEEVKQINSSLSGTLQAMEQGDPVLLADYLEYKVLPNIITL